MWLVACFGILASTVFLLLSLYLGRVRRFWKRLNVPHTQPGYLLGDFRRGGFSNNLGVLLKKFYDEFAGERFFGVWMFTNPVLIVRDPELVKRITVKDFGYFHDRGLYYNEKDDPLSAHLFAVEGFKWKNLRVKLTPTFTSGKMKLMFPLMLECGRELRGYLEGAVARGKMDVREVAAMFMTDVISLCAFGIETNSLKDPNSEFRRMGKKFLEPTLRNTIFFYLLGTAPKLLEFLQVSQNPKEPADFFLGAIREVMENREKNKIRRNDFMQLLMELKNDGFLNDGGFEGKTADAGEKLTFEEAAAQAFVFFLGGFETSSSTVLFAMYELAKNPPIQKRLREEISSSLAKREGKITYEGVHDMPYLDKVIEETLRKYPVVSTLQRSCRRSYRIPDSDVVIPEGTLVHIPIYGFQMDEKYFPEPEKFDPERFSEEEKQKRHGYVYLPFGEGPRGCIGKRFGQIQVRLALIILLQHFKYELDESFKDPISFDPKSLVLTPRETIMLKISHI